MLRASDVDDGYAARFWARVDRSAGDAACWVWTRARNSLGYGATSFAGNVRLTHRIAYALHYGETPQDKVLDHLCRNPACCNPRHLEAVSQSTNTVRGNLARGAS